jgi:hypothetical protein
MSALVSRPMILKTFGDVPQDFGCARQWQAERVS